MTDVFKRKSGQTLPEGEEDDGLDGQELADRVVRGEHVFRGLVEEEETVESKGDTEVVDHGDIEISTIRAPVTIPILSESFKDKSDDRHEWLHSTELESSLFAEAKKSYRISSTRKTTGPIVPGTADRPSSDL